MIFTNVTDNSINKLTEDGTITKLYKGFPLDAPVGLAFDDEGVLYVSNYEEKKVFALINQELKYITTLPGKVTSKCGKKE
jgi:DNA-binding beta-propeller fold protein YncE